MQRQVINSQNYPISKLEGDGLWGHFFSTVLVALPNALTCLHTSSLFALSFANNNLSAGGGAVHVGTPKAGCSCKEDVQVVNFLTLRIYPVPRVR
jgi:hypothetical protein